MSKKKSGRPHGHYCKICGEYKANEKFSGRGHATHICKACSHLSAAEKAEAQTITRLTNFPMGPRAKRGWRTAYTIIARRLRSWRGRSTISIGGKYKPLILWHLVDCPLHYMEL